MLTVAQVVILLTALFMALLVLMHVLREVKSQLHMEEFIVSLMKIKPRYYT